MPTPPLRVFRVNTCAPVENRDPQEQATLCFAGCELPPGAAQGTATVPAPIILPTVVKTLPAGIHAPACVPQDRHNPPRLYRYWKTRYSDCSHLDPGSGNFVTYGELVPVMHLHLLPSSLHWTPVIVDYSTWHTRYPPCVIHMKQVHDPEQLQLRWPAPVAVHWDFQLWWKPTDYHARKVPDFQSLLEFCVPSQRRPEDLRRPLLPNIPQQLRRRLPDLSQLRRRGPMHFSLS